MTGHDVIEAFGGKHSVMALTGAKRNAVNQWREAGIPAKYWHIFVGEAERRTIPGITFDSLAETKPERRAIRGSVGASPASA